MSTLTKDRTNGSSAAMVPSEVKQDSGKVPQLDLSAKPFWLCEVSGEPITPEVCFACSRQRQQAACDFTPPLLRALYTSMHADPALQAVYALAQQAGVTLLRVSSLTGCSRQAWYRLHQHTPLEKPSRHWPRLRGSIFHRALQEMAGKESVAERRFVVSLQTFGVAVWIAGQIDHYDPRTGVLTDLKTINSNGRRLFKMDLPQAHHQAQLWLYAWLLAQSGWPYPHVAQILYVDMGQVRRTQVPLPTPDQRLLIEKRLVAKARLIAEADATGPPGDARAAWMCRYCLFKQGCPDRDKTMPEQGKQD